VVRSIVLFGGELSR